MTNQSTDTSATTLTQMPSTPPPPFLLGLPARAASMPPWRRELAELFLPAWRVELAETLAL